VKSIEDKLGAPVFGNRRGTMTVMTSVAVALFLSLGSGSAESRVLGNAAASDTLREETAREETALIQGAVVRADNVFGLKLFREINKGSGEDNVFISPLSVAMALGMTYNGAAGGTAAAMRNTLELGEIEREHFNKAYGELMGSVTAADPEVLLSIANSIWCREGVRFKEDFLSVNEQFFDAELRALDFTSANAADVINKWVSDRTNARIREIVNAGTLRRMVMTLINAIYFKGTWAEEFDERRTEEDTFTLADGSKMKCGMMVQDGEFDYLEREGLQAIDLPYGNGRFRATVILPREGVSVDSLVSELSETTWRHYLGGLNRTEVILELPKFKLEYELPMVGVLSELGMGVAFDPKEADFSGMYGGPDSLYISEVMHKTFVQVDEEGTEAAAVTAVTMGTSSVRQISRMRVDRPFIFAIRDSQSSALLFIGKIVEPSWEEDDDGWE
jgi:serpin B